MRTQEEKKEYCKRYYGENRELITENMRKHYEKTAIKLMLHKLNNGEYHRIPHEKMEKYNIKLDESTNKYIIRS